MNTQIPLGNYCYGYWILERSGRRPVPGKTQVIEWADNLVLPEPQFCPHWQTIEGGRVRCTLLNATAPILGCEDEWRHHYDAHPESREADKGSQFDLGDAVKMCGVNLEQPDFCFRSEST